MFLLRSIRRRLVSLLGLAFGLMLALAGIGLFGLLGHREAVQDLDFLLYKSPNKDQLSRAVTRISESLFNELDLKQPAAVEVQRARLQTAIETAVESLFDFRRKFEALPPSEELSLQQRGQVLKRLDQVYGELHRLTKLEGGLRAINTPEDQRAVDQLRIAAASSVTQIQRTLDTLPAYQTHSHVELSLAKEQERSARRLRWLAIVTVFVVVMFAIILACGLKWISEPARTVANGCIRIASGDTRYRLQPVSMWNDEFTKLVAGVNMVADRFIQAEEDLLHQVKAQSEQLVRTHRLAGVGFLAAGVAHEINNPLNAISLAADSLEGCLERMADSDSPAARTALNRIAMIRSESKRCGEITARLLDFSRSDRSEKQSENVTSLIQEVLLVVEHLGRFSDRQVVFDSSRRVTAELLASQIKQVILNLVVNALQASPPGGTVTIELLEKVDSIVLTVSDSGCGMDCETLEHIFDPFYTKQEVGQGTGLGLSISHRIIEDHNGTITPFSDGAGCGSTFQVRLPRRQQQARNAA